MYIRTNSYGLTKLYTTKNDANTILSQVGTRIGFKT